MAWLEARDCTCCRSLSLARGDGRGVTIGGGGGYVAARVDVLIRRDKVDGGSDRWSNSTEPVPMEAFVDAPI